MLRLGYDAKRVFSNYTGLGNYSRTLLRNLAERYPEFVYYLFTPKVKKGDLTHHFLENPNFEIRLPAQAWLANWWRTYGMTKDLQKHRIDLYHGLSHELPFGIHQINIPSIVTIHDLIFKRYPKQYRLADREIYDAKFKYAVKSCERVVAISAQTKTDLMTFYGVQADKIEVIYQSCHPRFYQKKDIGKINAVKAKYHLPGTYMLNVGSIIERKNLLGIIEAMAQLKPVDQIPLVVVGKGKKYHKLVLEAIKRYQLSKLVYFPAVHSDDLPALYQGASLFLYPSYYEGFGLPVLEALWSNVPIITSNVSSLPEVGGNAAIQIAPDQPEAIADAIQRILHDESLAKKMRKVGFEQAQRFKPDLVVEDMMACYEHVLGADLRHFS